MRTVHELTPDELEELQSMWYYQHLDDGSMEEVLGYFANIPSDVPMDVVKTYYMDTYFVEDDFFCNI